MEYPIASGEKNRLTKPGLEVYFGIEINPLPSDSAFAEFQLCTHDAEAKSVFEGLTPLTTHLMFEDPGAAGVYTTQMIQVDQVDDPLKARILQQKMALPLDQLRHAIRVRVNKAGLLKSYDEADGATTYRTQQLAPSEDMIAEVHICLGGLGNCLTGCGKTANDILRDMYGGTVPGMERILVVLDEEGKKIMSCFIDGILYIDQDTHKVKTAR